MSGKTGAAPPKAECSAFCPKCKSDLYYLDGVCYCKNTNCDYMCDKCKKEKDKLFFADSE
ncbi:hypothetical protein LJC56_07695 [Christensenellaceae bacterium OttesenSCG-928-K19]|nr:hypothetical protein [Christensenellaceae bacterium OttesenSCG-928-K19]